jgi:peptidase E
VTDSFGPQLEPMDCLGFLGGSFCPHWDDEELRRPRYHGLLRDGMASGYAAEAGVGLHFVGGELRQVVACREGTGAFRVELHGGDVRETPLEARAL